MSERVGVPGAGNSVLGRSLQSSILRGQASLDYSLRVFEKYFKFNSDEAVASVLINHFELIDVYGALNDYVSATIEFEKAWRFLESLLTREGLNAEQYESISRGANRLKSEWSVYLSYGNRQVPDESQIIDYLNIFSKKHNHSNRVLH